MHFFTAQMWNVILNSQDAILACLLCLKIHWCQYGYKWTVSGVISPLPYLGQSNLPTDIETLLEAVWTACDGQGLSEGKFE